MKSTKQAKLNNIHSDSLLEAMVAHEGGHDGCGDTSGFSRKVQKRQTVAVSACEPGNSIGPYDVHW